MVSKGQGRKLAAIVAVDVAGYSRLVSADEEATLRDLRSHRAELIDPKIAEHHGRIVNTAGDSVLAEFPSVVEAMRCAKDIQQEMQERNALIPKDKQITFRIGVNLGDVIEHDGDLLGDGVNVAARLEALAEPGGICLSRAARDQIVDRLEIGFEDLGKVKLKNIARPVHAFRVALDRPPYTNSRRQRLLGAKPNLSAMAIALVIVMAGAGAWMYFDSDPSVVPADPMKMVHPLPEKPSIAVLPFANNSDNEEQAYFADGISEAIVNDLSKVSGIFTAAYNSTNKYKGSEVKLGEVAEDLGVRYVLDGSVHRADGKLRIAARLIDAIKGNQIWAERYDRDEKELFAVQADLALRIVKAVKVTINANEHERLYRSHTTNFDAYDTFLRARNTVLTPSRKNIEFAENLFKRVIELDPNFAGGYAGLSLNHSMKVRFGYGATPELDKDQSLDLAKKAVDIDKDFAWSYIALGGAYLANGNPDAAVDSIRQALVIQPNGYEENLFMGFYAHFAGQSALAVEHLEKADRISPVDTVRKLSFLAMGYFMNENYEKSALIWEKRIRNYPVGNPIPYVYLAAAFVLLNRPSEAAAVAAKFRELNPEFRLSKWHYIDTYKTAENRSRLYDAAKKAGIAE